MSLSPVGPRLSLLAALLVACGTSTPGASVLPVTPRRTWSDAEIDTLGRRLDSLRQDARIPGLSIALVESGRVISTAADLARFDLALDTGSLLTATSRAVMWTPTSGPDGKPFPYGLGWFIRTVRGEALVWHTGLWEGAYSALYLKIPARGVSLILLANSDGLQFPTPLDAATIETSPFAMALLDALQAGVRSQ